MYLRRVTQSLYLGGALCAARSYWPTVSSVVLRNRLISISASIFIICSEQLPVWAKLICAAKNVWFMGTLSSQAKIFALFLREIIRAILNIINRVHLNVRIKAEHITQI